MLSLKENLISFLIGASVIGSLVSFGYIGAGFAKWRKSGNWDVSMDVNKFEWMMFSVMILLGLFNVLAQNLVEEYNWYGWNVIIGALFGLTLSLIGRFGFDFPVKVFDFNRSNEMMVHLYAMLLYGFVVFGGIIGGVSHLILK